MSDSNNTNYVTDTHFSFSELVQLNLPVVIVVFACIIGLLFFFPTFVRILERKSLRFNLMVLVISSITTSTVIGIITEYFIREIGKNITEIVDEDFPMIKTLAEVEVHQMEQSIWFERAMLYSLKGEKKSVLKAEEKSIEEAHIVDKKLVEAKKIAEYAIKHSIYPETTQKFQSILSKLNSIAKEHLTFDEHMIELYEYINQGNEPTLKQLHKLEGEEDHLNHSMATLLIEVEDFTLKAGKKSLNLEKNSEFLLMLFNLFSLLLLLFNSVLVLKVLSAKLRTIESSLSHNYEKLQDLSVNLNKRSQNLSTISQRQVSSLNQTATSIDEIESSVQSNSSEAHSSEEISSEVSETAKTSDVSMQELLQIINEITESNKEIEAFSKMIHEIAERTKIIDNIVFQTKLLSFNASVEAERAGEHGRGFAVVAQEVNNLAALSGKAALEISDIVNNSVNITQRITSTNAEKVHRSLECAETTAKNFSMVRGSAESLLSKAKIIATSSADQTKGVQQINKGISEVQEDVKTSSSDAHALADMCQDLEGELNSLGTAIQTIKVLSNS